MKKALIPGILFVTILVFLSACTPNDVEKVLFREGYNEIYSSDKAKYPENLQVGLFGTGDFTEDEANNADGIY